MRIASLLVGLFLIVATVMPIINASAWWIRIFDFPRLQITALIGATLVFLAIRWGRSGTSDKALAVVLLGCLFYQLYMIHPYTIFASKQVLDADDEIPRTGFRLLIANVLMTNRNVSKFMETVRGADPDIVLVVENDDWWDEQLTALEKDYPFMEKHPLGNTYGMSLYSRLRLMDTTVKFLVEEDVPSIHTLVEMESGDLLQLHCLHPKPPHPAESDDTTERDAELVIVGKTAKNSSYPVVIAGDLNDVAWSRTTKLFQKVSGLLDPRVGRGVYNTFHAKYPFLRWPLDHVFHSDHFKLVDLKTLPYFGSDHFPVFIHLSYVPQERGEQEAPVATPEEEEEAAEKVEEAEKER